MANEDIFFTGFGGTRLRAAACGDANSPAVLLLHGAAQSSAVWRDIAAALAAAGRFVISLDLRGHGESEWTADGHYDFGAFVEDLRLVLAQLASRPAVIAAGLGAWIAIAALGSDSEILAAGLVLVDVPTDLEPATIERIRVRFAATVGAAGQSDWDVRWLQTWTHAGVLDRITAAAPNVKLPILMMRGTLSDIDAPTRTAELIGLLPDIEMADIKGVRLLIADHALEEFNAVVLDFLERRQPRGPAEYRSGSDSKTLRDALGCFATGITIVTALAPARTPIGLTANSFTSVSLDPPLILVCIGASAGSAVVLRDADRFAVNVLQIGQQPASSRFASRSSDRFAAMEWNIGEMGAPVLSNSLCAFECEHFAVHDAGDHFILLGRVLKATFEPRRDPLLYFRGKYRRLHFA